MRKMGLEPTRPNGHKILSLARLPIPTLPRTIKPLTGSTICIIALWRPGVNTFFSFFYFFPEKISPAGIRQKNGPHFEKIKIIFDFSVIFPLLNRYIYESSKGEATVYERNPHHYQPTTKKGLPETSATVGVRCPAL